MKPWALELRRMREERGWSRETLSEKTAAPGVKPITSRTIADIEGGAEPKIETVRRLVRTLAGTDEAIAGVLLVRFVLGIESPLEKVRNEEETGSDSPKSPVPSEARSTA